jgi:hypothetical protein
VKLRLGVALAAALLAASGCGGDDGDTETTTAQGATSAREQGGGQRGSTGEGNRQSAAGGGNSSGAASDQGLGAVVENPTPRQLGIKQGFDNSIQTYGSQAAGRERDSAILAMRGLFRMLAEGDLEAACSAYFSSDYLASLLQLAEGLDVQPGDRPCATAARLLDETTDGDTLTEEARKALAATVLRVGVKGEEAIVTLRTRQDVIAYFVLRREDGEWKATAFAIAPLRPVA